MPEIIGLTGIKQILGNRQAVLRMQPIYSFFDGAPVQHEALLRLLDSSGDEVPPQQFLSAVVQNGLLPAMDLMTVTLLETQLGALNGGLKTPVTLNISTRSLIHQPYIDYLTHPRWVGLLDRLVLELKIGDLVQNGKDALGPLKNLRKQGTAVSLNYHAGGAAMVKVAVQMGIDYLKFDTKPFSLTYSDNERKQAEEAVTEAKNSRIRVIFERVETEHDLNSIRPYKPEMVQGFVFGWPQFNFVTAKTPLLAKTTPKNPAVAM